MPDGLSPDIALRERCLSLAVDRLGVSTRQGMAEAVVVAAVMVDFVEKGEIDWDTIEAIDGEVIREFKPSGAAASQEGGVDGSEESTRAAPGDAVDADAHDAPGTNSAAGVSPPGEASASDDVLAAPLQPLAPQADAPVAEAGAAAESVAVVAADTDRGEPAEWDEPTRTRFTEAYEGGVGENDIRLAFKLTWEQFYGAVRLLGLGGSVKRREAKDAARAARASQLPRSSKKPSPWNEQRDAEFHRLWLAGEDPEVIARHFKDAHGLDLTPGSVSARASVRGLSNNPTRKANRAAKLAALADARLVDSVAKGKKPVSAIAGTLLMVPLESTAARIPSNSAGIRQDLPKSAAIGIDLAPGPDVTVKVAAEGGKLVDVEVIPPADVSTGPPRADTAIFAKPVHPHVAAAVLRDSQLAAERAALASSRPATKPQERPKPAGGAGRPAASRVDTIRQQMARINGTGGAKDEIVPSGSARDWPQARIAYFTARWKAGDDFAPIAEAMTRSGWPMRTGDVVIAVAQLQLRDDPDRIAARRQR